MLKRASVIGFVMCAVLRTCVAGGFSGTAACGAQVSIDTMRNRGTLNRDEIKALEKAFGGELLFAEVNIDNSNGKSAFTFYTICCDNAFGVNGAGQIAYANLRSVAKSVLGTSSAALFDDQTIPAGAHGFFLMAWSKSQVKSLSSFSGINLVDNVGPIIVECH